MSYTKFKGSKNRVEAEVLQFIPLGFSGEIQKVSLKNSSSNSKQIKLFSFIEWCL
jgi:cellobiose phosphorylase